MAKTLKEIEREFIEMTGNGAKPIGGTDFLHHAIADAFEAVRLEKPFMKCGLRQVKDKDGADVLFMFQEAKCSRGYLCEKLAREALSLVAAAQKAFLENK